MERSQRQLSAVVGSLAAISLGLETMGSCIGVGWTEEEEEALCAGMRAYGRDFHAIQSDYVPSRSVHDLIDYYYNVLKLKATQRAVQWHEEKAQVGLSACWGLCNALGSVCCSCTAVSCLRSALLAVA